MKIRVITIMLCIILSLSVIGNVLVYATIDKDKVNEISDADNEAQDVKIGEKFIEKNIEEQKNVVLSEKTDVATYENSVVYSQNRVLDYYVSDTCRYTFNRQGELVGWYDLYALNTSEKVKEEITKKQAADIARGVIGDELDIKTDELELTYCYFNESSGMYYLTYSKVYNGFIIADSISVNLTKGGTVVELNATWYGVFEDFDADCIKGLTKDKIEDYVKDQIIPMFSKVNSYEIQSIMLRKPNDEYVIELGVGIEYETDGEVTSVLNSWYYEI